MTMPVIKIKFGGDAERLSDHFKRMVDNFFQMGISTGTAPQGWQPPLTICEDEGFLYIMADMAGVSRERCGVTVEGRFVKIKGTRSSPLGPGSKRFYFMEMVYGDGERIVKLPCEVKAEEASAQIENGLLVVKLPKRETDDGVKIEVENKEG